MDGVGCRLIMFATGIIFEGDFKGGICPNVGRLCYPNGNIYYG